MPHSGKHGKAEWKAEGGTTFAEIPHVKQWSFDDTSDNKSYASSSTTGRMRREPGNGDASGTVEVYAEEDGGSGAVENMLSVGDKGTFRLTETTGRAWLIPVVIDKFGAATDIEGAEIVGYSIDFSGDGVITKPPAPTP